MTHEPSIKFKNRCEKEEMEKLMKELMEKFDIRYGPGETERHVNIYPSSEADFEKKIREVLDVIKKHSPGWLNDMDYDAGNVTLRFGHPRGGYGETWIEIDYPGNLIPAPEKITLMKDHLSVPIEYLGRARELIEDFLENVYHSHRCKCN